MNGFNKYFIKLKKIKKKIKMSYEINIKMSSGVVLDEDFHLFIFNRVTVTWSPVENVLYQNQFFMQLLYWFWGAPVFRSWVSYRVHTFVIGVAHTIVVHYACVVSDQRIYSVYWICLFSNKFLAWFLMIARFDLIFCQKVLVVAIIDDLFKFVFEFIGATGQCLFVCLDFHFFMLEISYLVKTVIRWAWRYNLVRIHQVLCLETRSPSLFAYHLYHLLDSIFKGCFELFSTS